jgi:hypothetical protein
MALPLNVYDTKTGIVSTTPQSVYTAPVGYTGVVLFAQVANTGNSTETVLFSYDKVVETNEIIPNEPVSSNDSIKLINGKLLVLSGHSLKLSGSNGSTLKYTISILETLN